MILKDKEKSKDKEKEKNRTDLDIEEVALMFPTGPLVLRQVVPRLDRPEERGDTVHLFYFLFRHFNFLGFLICFFFTRVTKGTGILHAPFFKNMFFILFDQQEEQVGS